MPGSHPSPSNSPFSGPARRIGWIAVALSVPGAVTVVLASGMRPVAQSFLPVGLPAILLLAAHIVYARWRPDPRVVDATGLMAMMILACLLAAVISHAGLRLRFPYVDESLAAADRAMGFGTPRLALKLALSPVWSNWLAAAYVSSFPAAFLLALALSLTQRAERAWELAAAFSACILTAAATSVFWPAIGSMVYHAVDGTKGLPPGSGNYHLAAVAYYRSGDAPSLDMARFSGIVTMPSFHMILALIVPFALRGTGWPFQAALLWCAVVTLSTIGIGGHYVVDLIAGAVLWAGVAWCTRGCIFPEGTLKGPRNAVLSVP